MHNNDNLLFDAPTTSGANINELKISIIALKAGDYNGAYADLERTQMAIKSLNAGTWTLDIATYSLTICKRCTEIIPVGGLKNISVKSFCDFIIPGYKKKVAETFLLGIQKEGLFDVEVPVMAVKGSGHKWLRIAGAVAFDDRNSLPKIHGIVEDISERKNSELLKQDFLAMVSHDLRSPLSVIKLYMQVCDQLAGNNGDYRIPEMLKKAGLQVHKMDRMIQCYLESSAIASGKISYSPTWFDVETLLKEVIGDVHLLYPGHILFLNPGPCIKVCADRDKIAQVLQNLLTNAIKYSSRMDVISIHFEQAGSYLQVAVKDHGIGIKAADQERIFDRFYRVEGEKEKTVKGYGIGLYLSKEIIKKHSGDIRIESEVGKGSKFYFTLPLS